MTYKELMSEFRQAEITGGDKWGSAMGVWFDVADELCGRGDDIPYTWQYSPGLSAANGVDPESYWAGLLIDATTDTLREFGEFLHRYSNRCRHAGLNY